MSCNGTLIFGRTAGGLNLPLLVGNDGSLVAGLTVGDITLGTVSINQTTPGTTNGVVINSSALPTDAATETTSAAILAKLLAAPATEAAQTTGNGTLSTINGKITACDTGAVTIAASALPSGAATQTTLAALDAKVTACNTGAVVIASGAVTSTPNSVTLSSSTAYEASRVVKASAGTLRSLTGYNSGPAQFIQLHNTASLPADGQAPILILPLPATSGFAFEWVNGIPCSTGITLCNSTTGPTKTIGGANCFFTAGFN
jgi:hypothetical protein